MICRHYLISYVTYNAHAILTQLFTLLKMFGSFWEAKLRLDHHEWLYIDDNDEL